MTKDTTINITRLEELIAAYFNGETSVEEERQLRQALASTDASSPEIDEARAVMGVFAAMRSKPRRNRLTFGVRFANAAASIAVVFAIGAALVIPTQHAEASDCYVIVGNQRIDDREQVKMMMESNLASISDASSAINASMQSDLAALSSAFE